MKRHLIFILLYLIFVLLCSCKKEKPSLPAVTTSEVSEITHTTATSGGTVTDDGGSPIISKGVCWNTEADPSISNNKTTDGTGSENFTSSVTGLMAGKTYHIRAYATNSVGTAYGDEITFTTLSSTPVLKTNDISDLTQHTCNTGGTISSDGGFNIIQNGVCWSTSPNPTTSGNKTVDGVGSMTFTSSLNSLSVNTTYYVRAYATNSEATGYGNEVTFTTVANQVLFNPAVTYGSVTDIDGNNYKTVQIATQVWMAENLKTSKFQNGDRIATTPSVTSNISGESSPEYQWMFDGIEQNVPVYGRLYTWYVASDNRNVCPAGWRVPSAVDWSILLNNVGGISIAGDKFKETGLNHWNKPNTSATNETGFTVIPAGFRLQDGTFVGLGLYAWFWSSYNLSVSGGTAFSVEWNLTQVMAWESNKFTGCSIRCIKN